MIESFRHDFNARFTQQKYAEVLRRLDAKTGTHIEFRIAETPCFFERVLMDEMVAAGIELTHQLLDNPEYMRHSDAAIPDAFRVPGEDAHPHFMTVDFGLVRDATGALRPKLVEMQAFPSIFGYQPLLSQEYIDVFELDGSLEYFFGGMDADAYWKLMREVIVAGHAPENVVLAEVDPATQKTLPDFLMHEQMLGIRTVDVTKLVKRGRKLHYERDGGLVPIHRIYNRVIVDELERKGIKLPFDYRDDLDVEWAGHPNWYFRISKFSIPYLDHPTVPAAVFLDDWYAGKGRERLPADREQWVFKPLYSFAGKGIQFAPSDADLDAVPMEEWHNYLLQERVQFEPVIQTPEGPTQAEIRILYVWPDDGEMIPMISLVRMGRGLMMGVDHNRDKTWVGGSAGLFPPDGEGRKAGKYSRIALESDTAELPPGAEGRAMSSKPPAENPDPVRTAVRFPLHLDVLIHWEKGDVHAVTEDVSANGILFVADNPPPVDSRIEYRLTMPAEIMGGTEDVTLHCIGRIVRHQQTAGKQMAAAVIDEYSLKAEH